MMNAKIKLTFCDLFDDFYNDGLTLSYYLCRGLGLWCLTLLSAIFQLNRIYVIVAFSSITLLLLLRNFHKTF